MAQGIGFYSVEGDETHYAKSEAQIQGYLNSSDLGINASRGQDKGWRIEPKWMKMVKAFRQDEAKMSLIASKNGGQAPSVPQILYAIYGEQIRQEQQTKNDESRPYEEKSLRAISSQPEEKPTACKK